MIFSHWRLCSLIMKGHVMQVAWCRCFHTEGNHSIPVSWMSPEFPHKCPSKLIIHIYCLRWACSLAYLWCLNADHPSSSALQFNECHQLMCICLLLELCRIKYSFHSMKVTIPESFVKLTCPHSSNSAAHATCIAHFCVSRPQEEEVLLPDARVLTLELVYNFWSVPLSIIVNPTCYLCNAIEGSSYMYLANQMFPLIYIKTLKNNNIIINMLMYEQVRLCMMYISPGSSLWRRILPVDLTCGNCQGRTCIQSYLNRVLSFSPHFGPITFVQYLQFAHLHSWHKVTERSLHRHWVFSASLN